MPRRLWASTRRTLARPRGGDSRTAPYQPFDEIRTVGIGDEGMRRGKWEESGGRIWLASAEGMRRGIGEELRRARTCGSTPGCAATDVIGNPKPYEPLEIMQDDVESCELPGNRAGQHRTTCVARNHVRRCHTKTHEATTCGTEPSMMPRASRSVQASR
ncbi:hypothetical protein BHE74_00044533 [Ensete ventricosum]|nr:hypothetical protein BHE74_00044533 [Ensete ventricosum]